jgi:hypothetical protein
LWAVSHDDSPALFHFGRLLNSIRWFRKYKNNKYSKT